MRSFRKRRRPRVIWLPNTGSQFTQAGAGPATAGENPSFITSSFGTVLNGAITLEAPMVTDLPAIAALEDQGVTNVTQWQQRNLNDTEQKGYRLRRIVGDFFAGIEDDETGVATAGVLLSMGIIVRRVDEETGASLESGVGQDVNSIQNNSDPWIFRRNWVLGTGPIAGDVSPLELRAIREFPKTTAGYGTSRQAVDQRTNRIISQAERLIFNLTAWILPVANAVAPTSVPTVWFLWDYRCVATLFTQAGNRRNSSR